MLCSLIISSSRLSHTSSILSAAVACNAIASATSVVEATFICLSHSVPSVAPNITTLLQPDIFCASRVLKNSVSPIISEFSVTVQSKILYSDFGLTDELMMSIALSTRAKICGSSVFDEVRIYLKMSALFIDYV